MNIARGIRSGGYRKGKRNGKGHLERLGLHSINLQKPANASEISDDLSSATKRIRKANVINSLCIGCGICTNICKYRAISMQGVAKIDLDKCTGCGDCVNVCPRGAITLKDDRD